MAEPKVHYRRRYDRDGATAITRRAEQKVAAQAPHMLERTLHLSERLQQALQASPQTTGIWFELEEALHAYWLEIATAHYDLGIAAARRHPIRYAIRSTPRQRALALAQALRDLANDLADDS